MRKEGADKLHGCLPGRANPRIDADMGGRESRCAISKSVNVNV